MANIVILSAIVKLFAGFARLGMRELEVRSLFDALERWRVWSLGSRLGMERVDPERMIPRGKTSAVWNSMWIAFLH